MTSTRNAPASLGGGARPPNGGERWRQREKVLSHDVNIYAQGAAAEAPRRAWRAPCSSRNGMWPTNRRSSQTSTRVFTAARAREWNETAWKDHAFGECRHTLLRTTASERSVSANNSANEGHRKSQVKSGLQHQHQGYFAPCWCISSRSTRQMSNIEQRAIFEAPPLLSG